MPSETWVFAEGVQNSFFSTFVLLQNPGTDPATATLTFDRAFGEPPVIQQIALPPMSRVTVDTGTIPGLSGRSFGLSNPADSIARPVLDFVANAVTFSNGANLSEFAQHPTLPPHSRLTIPIDTIDGTSAGLPEAFPLADTEFALRIFVDDVPIVAERAMYWLGAPGPWADGTSSFGTTTTGVRWGTRKAAPAARSTFHTCIRIFNPNYDVRQSADVTVTFIRDDGSTVVKTYRVPPFVFSQPAPPRPFVKIDVNTTIPSSTVSPSARSSSRQMAWRSQRSGRCTGFQQHLLGRWHHHRRHAPAVVRSSCVNGLLTLTAGGTLYDGNMTNEELFAGTAVKNWKLVIDRLNATTTTLSDEAMQKEVSPGRNRVYYLIGHLTAVHDRMFPLLGLGERLHPELDDLFIAKPDRAVPQTVTSADLRKAFVAVNTRLTAAIEALPPADWLQKHAAVSHEDFVKEPLRNRIAVLQSRTAHASFHEGQIRLTQER